MTAPGAHPVQDLGPAALGLLTRQERAALDRHLEQCFRCSEELASLASVVERLGELDDAPVLRALEPEARRVDAVLVRVAAARTHDQRRWQRRQAVLAAAASAVVLVAGVTTAAALSGTSATEVPVETVAVETAGAGVEASAGLVAHTWGVEIKLTATGLASGPYSVRVTTRGGEVVDAGAFLGTGDRTMLCNLNTAVLRPEADAFVVLDQRGTPVLTADL